MHLADAFIQSDLHCIQVTVSTFCQALLSLGIEPMILALASAMLYQLSYKKANYIFVSLFRIYLLYNVCFFSLFLFSRSGVMSNMRPKTCDGLAIQQGLL